MARGKQKNIINRSNVIKPHLDTDLVPLFTGDMIVYISGLQHSTRELLQLINTFSKVPRFKITSKKSVAFLYTNDKLAEKEIRETTPLTLATNNIKFLGVTLTT
jgi:hypothetical protein